MQLTGNATRVYSHDADQAEHAAEERSPARAAGPRGRGVSKSTGGERRPGGAYDFPVYGIGDMGGKAGSLAELAARLVTEIDARSLDDLAAQLEVSTFEGLRSLEELAAQLGQGVGGANV